VRSRRDSRSLTAFRVVRSLIIVRRFLRIFVSDVLKLLTLALLRGASLISFVLSNVITTSIREGKTKGPFSSNSILSAKILEGHSTPVRSRWGCQPRCRQRRGGLFGVGSPGRGTDRSNSAARGDGVLRGIDRV